MDFYYFSIFIARPYNVKGILYGIAAPLPLLRKQSFNYLFNIANNQKGIKWYLNVYIYYTCIAESMSLNYEYSSATGHVAAYDVITYSKINVALQSTIRNSFAGILV